MSKMEAAGHLIADLIDGTVTGTSTWKNVVTELGHAFPGSFVAAHNKNFATQHVNFVESHNLEQAFLDSYVEHFSSINPWIKYWSAIKPGVVAASEKVAPAHLFKNTEFYNDWMRPQGSVDAAAGVKIQAESGETVQLLLHYPISHAEHYDIAAIRVLERIKGSLNRSVEFARSERQGVERAIGVIALIAREPRPAFLMLADQRLVVANQSALDMFAAGSSIKTKRDKVFLAHTGAQAAFEQAVAQLCRQKAVNIPSIAFATDEGRWRLSLNSVAPNAYGSSNFATLLPVRRMVVVVVTDIGTPSAGLLDRSAIRTLFGLTPAETNLCSRLLTGETVSDAAAHLTIATETARTRLKSILAKTETSRQAELVLLLTRLTEGNS